VLSNVFQNQKGQKIAFGMDEQASSTEIIKDWADKFAKFKPLPPSYISTGPVMENIISGQDINILKFPVPKWNELDGGPYIGTAHAIND
jgi:4-hydroxy-3-polyprenylbenzoate decarboxylase